MRHYESCLRIDVPQEFGSFQEIEHKILCSARQAGQELIKHVLKDYENTVIEESGLRKKDRPQKTYHTLLGSITIKRWRVEEGGPALIDQWLGLEGKQKRTAGFQELTIQACTHLPYEKARDHIYQLTGVALTGMTHWRFIQKEADKQRGQQGKGSDWRKKNLPVLKKDREDPCPILAIDPDATYVRPRRKTDKRHEVKMAVLYSARSPVAKSKGKLRWELVNKQVVMAPVNSQAPDLFNPVTDKAVNDYGLHSKSRVICHADGDPWIKQLSQNYIPQTLNRLDPYHVFKKIREATGVEQVPPTWIKHFYKAPKKLIAALGRFKRQLADPEDRDRVQSLIGYCKNNLDGMQPSGVDPKIKQQYPRMYRRGSGTIESNIDWFIGARCKRSRMNWSSSGLNNLLFLRQQELNKNSAFKKVKRHPDHYYPDETEGIKEFLREYADCDSSTYKLSGGVGSRLN